MKLLLAFVLMGLIVAPTSRVNGKRASSPKDAVANYDRVDGKLCRGAQPDAAGLALLAKDGVTQVINLRHPDDGWHTEHDEVARLGMTYVNVPMDATATPIVEDIKKVIKLVEQNKGKTFVHCQYGCDRTGAVVACYRITKGMSNEEAFKDAQQHGISKLLPDLRKFIMEFWP